MVWKYLVWLIMAAVKVHINSGLDKQENSSLPQDIV